MKKYRIILLLLTLVFLCALTVACESGEVDDRELMIPPVSILRSDTGTEGELNATLAVRNGIRDKAGVELMLETDWVKRGEEIPAANCQIIVGNTNRTGSVTELEALLGARPNNDRDWSIYESEGSIYITGCSDAAINEAAAYFIENYVDETGIRMPVGERYLYQYPYAEISIGGEEIFAFSIPTAESPVLNSVREWLTDEIHEQVGWDIPEEGGKAIALRLDETLGKNDWTVKTAEGGVTVSGGSADAVKQGSTVMMKRMLDGTSAAGLDEHGTLALHTPNRTAPAVSGSYTSIGDPAYLIDDTTQLQSGWDRQLSSADWQTEALYSNSNYHKIRISNTKAAEPVWMERPFQKQTDGILTLETSLSVEAYKGLTFGILDSESGKYAMRLVGRDGKLYADDSTALSSNPNLRIRAEINLDTQKFTVWIDGAQSGPFDFTESVNQVDRLIFALDKDAASAIAPNFVLLHTNIPILDRFSVQPQETAPLGYTTEGNVQITSAADVQLTGAASMSRSFPAFDGKAAFEVKFLTNDFAENTSFAITSGGKNVFDIALSGMELRQGADVLRLYDSNFWYTLRIESDTRSKRAEVKINGKSYGWFDFETAAQSFDGIAIRTGDGDSVRVDDVKVFQINDHEDYVPAPRSSGSDGYYVAAQVCSLWRNGYHYGWDPISPFPELKPVLGYYDEGLPEVADWEIKYMAEHGIDYQLYCWYSSSVDQPIKNPTMSEHLHDGYFHAKYSDQMKFAIMWENANGTSPGNSENFRNVIVPYWVEYYLTDPRYMTIDNKPVITVFSLGDLLRDFGSVQGVKQEFDYLREVCRGLGFDGAIILIQTTARDASSLATVKSTGADAVYAYNWSKANTSGEYIGYVQSQYQAGMDNIATISVGFNNVAWNGTRSGLIKPEDYKTALEWVRDEHQKKYDEDEWLSRAIVLSTWNEYGEGTYIMPSGVHGFDYIDAVREVFAPDNEYENAEPTDAQLARLSTLYVQDRTLLRADYRKDVIDYDTLRSIIKWDFASGRNDWTQSFGLNAFRAVDGVLRGSSSQNDFAIQSADNLGIPTENIRAIRVTMKCSEPGVAAMYFTTEGSPDWSQNKSFAMSFTTAGEFTDIYILTEGNSALTGNLKRLRFDPNIVACEFEIKSIEILGSKEPARLVREDGELVFEKYYPAVDAGVIMIPFDPKQAMLTFLGCGYRWDDASQTLTVMHGDDTMTFTVGSDRSLVNGREITLSHRVESADGLPSLPIEDLLHHLGISGVTIVTG